MALVAYPGEHRHAAPGELPRVWEGIALHTTPEIPYRLEPEVALVTAGVEADVLGIGYADLAPEDVAAVVAAHPRPDFKRQIRRRSPRGSRIVPTPRSAPSTPTCWSTSCPGSGASTSSR
ncbi:hypothetical protein [Microbispora sitophila]|uniref:hypothetical protein n=1 Tax=Microbispora sitophila TaxID=2771537 RepID=UPI0021F74B0A|nr:hypothetical protein [Microbispora sitophila]